MTVLTTHVGSLPRTQEVVDFIFAREHGKPYDAGAFDTAMTAAVAETVRKQKDAGVGIVSDGETSKISYATYVKDRYTGFDGDSPRNAPADLKQFPGFLKRLADDGGTPQYARPMCVGEVKSKGQGELEKDIANLKGAMAANGVERGFMNAASPGVISLFLQNDHYATREAYLAALADAMKTEYETIVASGLDLQLDCPDLALSRHMLFNDLSDAEFLKIAGSHVEALNHALQDVPEEKVRIHICWGNYEGPHICDIPMATMPGYRLCEAGRPVRRGRARGGVNTTRPRLDRGPRSTSCGLCEAPGLCRGRENYALQLPPPNTQNFAQWGWFSLMGASAASSVAPSSNCSS